MIIWTGWGFFALIIAILPPIAFESALNAVFGPNYYQSHMLPKVASWLVAAVTLWLAGAWLAARPGRAVIDKESGQEMVLRPSHTLFWIPVRFWALPVLAFALWVVSDGLSRGDAW